MGPFSNWLCNYCGHVGLEVDDSDGLVNCRRCFVVAEDILVTGTADEDVGSGTYARRNTRRGANVMEVTPIQPDDPVYDSQPQLLKALGFEDLVTQRAEDDKGQSKAAGTLSYDHYYHAVRLRYIMGLQIMLQLQCEKLIEEFKVTPLICDLVEKIWLDFVKQTCVFDQFWADEVILESEMQPHAEENAYELRGKHKGEPQNKYGKRAVMMWYKSLRKTIPLDCTVAISFLACHLAREAILPTDIKLWAIERKLPYLAAFEDIEKLMGPPDRACPILSNQMFNPSRHVSPQGIESLAARIGASIGLELPPVNFFEIEHAEELQTYLKYCEDFVFAGLEPPSEYYEEKRTMEILWNYYQNFSQDEKASSEPKVPSNSCLKQKKQRDRGCSSSNVPTRKTKKTQTCLNEHQSTNDDDDDTCIQRMNLDDFHMDSSDSEHELKTDSTQVNEEDLKILKLDMEENKFHYIPPRTPKKIGYIRYARKKDGVLTYVAHADYYILLRACALAAQVDVRVMHVAVLSFEKRLGWIEDKIEDTLRFIPEKIRCEHCECRESKTRRKVDKSKTKRKDDKSKT
ncbi:hypothetical protein K1719_042670 [Acacia pycnantha]|nr:hypothetical protein K1719_042670 [Acacia pycnantha]